MPMNAIDLKGHVCRAIASSWDDFAREHPLLSQAIDQDVLVEQAMACIADDPEYRDAMEQAAAVGIGIGAVESFVTRFVGRWIKALV
jgi:hypothetical protein